MFLLINVVGKAFLGIDTNHVKLMQDIPDPGQRKSTQFCRVSRFWKTGSAVPAKAGENKKR